MGIELALAAIGTAAAIGGTVAGVVGGSKKPKAPKIEEPKLLSADTDTKKTGAQRASLIQTSPSGLNEEANLGRSKLLGN